MEQVNPLVIALTGIEVGDLELTESYAYVPYEIALKDDDEPVRWGDLAQN